MQTVIDNLTSMKGQIQSLLEDLILNHSSIYLWNTPGGSIAFISVQGNYAYTKLEEAGRKIQARLLDEYRRFYAMLSVLLRHHPKDTLTALNNANVRILRTIEQNHTWCKTTREALDKAVGALQDQLQLLAGLYESSCGEPTYVPDTNALLSNPDLEAWVFPDARTFTIVLLPTVLSELDSLKINHRNEDVRKKSESLIRRFKEYRRRGRFAAGVPLVTGKSQIQAIAVEPDMNSSLPWLDASNMDDCILAGTIEVMRLRPHSPVVAVSTDINFQNKADFAGIPCVEPPTI